jgi:predicted nucleotidyltransferase
MNTQIDNILSNIVERLKPVGIEKLILFGSYAYGTPTDNSDLDLLVVTGDDFIPANFKEKSELYLKVAGLLRDIEKNIPIDLIVHTKKMYRTFLNLNSMFCRKIEKDGVVLYDIHSQ